MSQAWGSRASVLVAIPVFAVITTVIVVFSVPLVATLGITVVAFGLFLPPRTTLVLAVLAVLTATGILLSVQFADEAVRLANTVVAASLGVAVSWAIQRRAQRLARLQHTQDSVFAQVPDGIAVLDRQGRIVQMNPGLRALVPTAAVGRTLHPVLGHIRNNGTTCPGGCALDAGARPQTTPHEGEWITRNGRRVAVEYTAAEADGEVVLSLRDVTPLRQAEEDRRLMLEATARRGEQESLLKMLGAPAYTELPEVPGLAFDMYSTPDPGERGDLVHVTALKDGRTLVSIVDALGEGMISLRDAWKVQYMAQSYVMAGTPLTDVVGRTAEALRTESDMPNASLMLATIDPRTSDMELVGGGHPPALLVRENGATEWLEGGGPGIGFGAPGAETPHHRSLTAGDSLVFYTDGLIDTSQDVIGALGTLRASAAALRRRETAGWAHSLAEAVLQGQTSAASATVLLVRVDSGGLQTMANR